MNKSHYKYSFAILGTISALLFVISPATASADMCLGSYCDPGGGGGGTAQINNASCASINAPSSVTPGQAFTATVVMSNTGTKTWTNAGYYNNGHMLGSQNPQDNQRWGIGRINLPVSSVVQGQNVTFTINATAPSTPGAYSFDWQMVQENIEWFGSTCSKTITVNTPPPPPPPPSCAGNSLIGHIISAGGNGSPATASVTNNATGCSKQVTFASYKMFVPEGQSGWLDTQVLYDYRTVTLGPGQTQTITIGTPSCKTQLDLYEGPVQPHLSDASGGFPGQNLLDWNINSSALCVNNPPPATLTCSPANQNVNQNQSANFTAQGGSGNYSWSGGESPATGFGPNFSTRYSASGNKTVTVTDGGQTAHCYVSVNTPPPPPPPPPACTGNSLTGHITSTGSAGSPATASATNSATGCSKQVTFASYKVYTTPGQSGWLDTQVLYDYRTVTLGPGETKTLTINTPSCYAQLDLYEGPVQPHLSDASDGFPGQNLLDFRFLQSNLCSQTTTLSCSPANQTVNVGQSANFTAQGGSGNYSWSGGGTPATGSGSGFSTSYSSSGNKTVTVSDGTQTAQCSVSVNQTTTALTCTPSNQTGNVGATLNFFASGGTGTYSWSTPDGNPASGNNANFSTSFSTAGNKTVTVTSGSQTATCSANIIQQSCNAPTAWLTSSSNVSGDSATLNGYVDPQGSSATYYFEYGTNTSFGYTTAQQTVSSAQSVSATINGLQPNITYYFRLVVQNSCGTNRSGAFTFWISNVPPWTPPIPPYYPPVYPPIYPPYYPPTYNQVYCTPQYQNANIGDWVGFSVTGGSGTYFWSGPFDANPSTGSNGTFGTRFSTPGTKTVTVNASGGGSAQCTVNVGTQYVYNPPTGRVLGAADVVTGPEDVWPTAFGLGFLASVLAYYFYFRKRLIPQPSPLRIQVLNSAAAEKPARKTELEELLEGIKAGESKPDA